MKKNTQLSILSILFIIIIAVTLRQAFRLRSEFKNVKRPTKESRQLGEMSTHKWITVKKMSIKYKVNEEEIFKTLDITPQKGDENLTLKELKEKYNKSQEEMKANIKKIIENHRDTKVKKHE